MKKIIILVVCILILGGIVYTQFENNQEDLTSYHLNHAAFYGLKTLAKDVYYDDSMAEDYSHADFKFWGVPDLK